MVFEGTVFSFGYNKYGDLGIGSNKNQRTPQKIKFENDEKIESIFSGYNCNGCFFYSGYFFLFFLHFFIFFNFKEKKNLFSCGKNDFNQKGIFKNSQNLKIPTKINFFKDIEINQIFTGCSSTFVQTKS
jgi:alpha-tubulin suppressor-like RCC1 family protein